ncbi:pinin/SDK/memA/ protein conserved region family protein [Theileria parva strain Muguga]|uniref:Pinin/SDK/MemA protein domain-containing protein n=1 Tax=Theileria parva TaxID=5875 RepID=Q4N6H7_THEPA|nr:pinin/SDK/memA/ protein conserved region family protein [Theileria parva strain Muguga]EAN34431.1 pinin/SDK/memA/ protein conserved region family protein [Theileria parva strain Muguga]|eukprot:XP_766714.1 hypothetical protein [Theileria parva strain Muguga]
MEVRLEDEIRVLIQERKAVNLALKKLSNQLTNFNNGDSNVLLSNKVLNTNSFDSKRKSKDDGFMDYEPEKRPRVEDDSETVHRHKRLMKVGLFGYLLKAKDALVKEKDDQKILKHIEKEKLIDTKLEEKQKEQSTLLQKDIQDEYDVNKKRLEEITTELNKKQTQLMRMRLCEHYESMGNFIATSTQPTIFWAPFKFNHHLNTLRDTTRNFIDKKIELIQNTNYYE